MREIPLFGNGTNSYPARSTQAHNFLGVCLVVVVLIWCLWLMEYIKRIRKAYLLSGGVQVLMGSYLLLWVFVLMHPADIAGLFAFVREDIVQLQHAAIATLLVAAGSVEVLIARGVGKSRHWQTIWAVCTSLTGIIFCVHPQHSFSSSIKHIFLGVCLAVGSLLFALSRRDQRVDAKEGEREEESADVDWDLLVAGGCFAIAGSLLLTYKEEGSPIHMSLTIECQGSWPLVILAWVVSAGTMLLALLLAGHARWKVWRARRELTRAASGEGRGTAGSDSTSTHASLSPSAPASLGVSGRVRRSRKGRHQRGRGRLRGGGQAQADDSEEAAESLIDLSSMADRQGGIGIGIGMEGTGLGLGLALALDVGEEQEDGDDEAEAIDEGLEEVEETLQALERHEERQPEEEEERNGRDREVLLDVRTLDATGAGAGAGTGMNDGENLLSGPVSDYSSTNR